MDIESQIQDGIGEDNENSELENIGTVGGARPKRRIKRTEKGKSYIAYIRWTDCHSFQRKVSCQMDRIVSLMENAENVDIVEKDLTPFRVTSEELKKSVAALFNDLETDEELNVANYWYAEQLSRMSNFVETTEQWISSAKNKIEENLESRSIASKLTGSSRRSKASSSKFSVASGRAKEKAKVAEIRAKVALLERKQELEKRTERLHLEEELAVAEAREKAYAEIEAGSMRERASIHGSLTTVQPQVPQSQPYSRFNPFTPEFRVARDSDQNASSGF